MIGGTLVQQNSIPIRNNDRILNNFQKTHYYQLPLVIRANCDVKMILRGLRCKPIQVLGSTSKSFSDRIPNFLSLT
jgi:hypothetical protein